MSDDEPRRKPTFKPGLPFIPLTEPEAEWLVMFGWRTRRDVFDEDSLGPRHHDMQILKKDRRLGRFRIHKG